MTATLYPTRTHGPRPVGRQVNYAARRFVAGVLVVMSVALMVVAASTAVAALLDVGGSPAVASDVATAASPRVHVAQPGDTMWSIADRYRGEVGHGRYVDALIDVNGGASIQIGQAIRLP